MSAIRIAAYMLSCPAREAVRAATLRRLAATDWGTEAVVVLDDGRAQRPQERQVQTSRRLLERVLADGCDLTLFLEDDLAFNRHLRHNLLSWQPLRALSERGGHLMASLYDPGVAARAWDHDHAYSIAEPDLVYGSQAFLLARNNVIHVLAGWERVPGMQDIKISRLAAEVAAIHYHRPSLVQHLPGASTWGGLEHAARDFSTSWRARAG